MKYGENPSQKDDSERPFSFRVMTVTCWQRARMDITELAERDSAERARLRADAIAEVRREIAVNRERHGRTDCLERHLVRLEAG